MQGRVLVYRVSRWFHRMLRCSVGAHRTHGDFYGNPLRDDSTPNNFCPGCGSLIRPEAFQRWTVTLWDGGAIDVDAINAAHAINVVVSDHSVHRRNISGAVRANSSTGVSR